MEEKKRLTATKKALEAFRESHKEFTDEVISGLVEKAYPDLYADNLEVAVEILKELYRRQEDLTEETFCALLKELTEDRKLVHYGKAERQQGATQVKVDALLDRIYTEAQQRTIYLSQCPEYEDADVKKYFEEIYSDKTLAQKFFAILNNKALRDAGKMSGIILPFHCYSEPNGDIVFTKNKRDADNYEASGKAKPIDKNQKSGCLGMVIFFVVIISSLFLL